jgi:hypothetical protein
MSAPIITPVAQRARWYAIDEALPEPLHDVLIEVALVPGDEPAIQMGYRRADGRWLRVAVEDIEVTPTRWTAMPALDDADNERLNATINPRTQEPFTLADMVGAAAREEGYRRRVYPRLVAEGRMKPRDADYQLTAMQAVRERLQRDLDALREEWANG